MRFDRYDRIVSHYASMWPLLVPGYIPILNAMLEVARTHPTQPRDVLDLGCGPGSATVAIAQACDPSGSVCLVDGSAHMLESARSILGSHVREAIRADYSTQNAVDAILQPDRYDLALCSFALHHLDDNAKLAVLEGLGRTVRHQGLLLLADEVAVDRPGGWQVVEQIRSRVIHEHLMAGRISKEFWELESSLPAEARLPFLPPRVDDLRSWIARAGFAVACLVVVFGSALFVGVQCHDADGG